VWSLADAAYWTKQGLWPTAGNIFAVEDVFSTYLYTGTGAAQTITNNINLSGSGGLVWIRSRSTTGNHFLFDTTRGVNVEINSNTTDSNATLANSLTAFNSNGFAISSATGIGVNGTTYASWTFREAPKFFDVVTYTGNGGGSRNITHNLGSVPGMILVKRTSSTATAWTVYHRSLANTQYMVLNTTAAVATGTTRWSSTTPTATEFTVGSSTDVNASGSTYVAYLFAHNAGGFGNAGTDSIISCDSYTGNGSINGPTVTLGWEPQWLMIKRTNSTGNWVILDNMRGLPVGSPDAILLANATTAETASDYVSPTATGFRLVTSSADVNASGSSYIYMAIRRGPMRTPTLGTNVFAPLYRQGNGVQTALSIGFPPDLAWTGQINNAGTFRSVVDRLRGVNVSGGGTGLITQVTQEEVGTYANEYVSFDQNGMTVSTGANQLGNASSAFFLSYQFFRRAPGFFDEVCYTGTGVAGQTFAHNLGVAPELMIMKARDNGAYAWFVYAAPQGANKFGRLDLPNAFPTASTVWNDTAPTASVFTLGAATGVNDAFNYVAYLFASARGVSKVGSYTGTGALQTIDCAFTTGARFVLIKRTDSTGDWFVWDSARGISSGNDPYLLLNTTAAEVTGTNYVDTTAVGFQVTAAAPAEINASGGTYIFLAIA
jgi:hypothetical protein